MKFLLSDRIDFTGAAIPLPAFLLNLFNKTDKSSLSYILMNVSGAALA